jgi:hypothetical protein
LRYIPHNTSAFNYGRQYSVIEEAINKFNLSKDNYREHETLIQKLFISSNNANKYYN